MIFTTNKRLTKTAETPLPYVESPVMTFSNTYRNFARNQQIMAFKTTSVQPVLINNRVNRNVPQEPESAGKPKSKSMKWGEPTWFLFHTLAEKIKPEYFQEVRVELLNIIYTICTNLPCPDCAKHATDYMNGVNFNTIITKDHLRLVLHRFHNEVNRRKGFAEFPLDQLSEKYSKADTVKIIHYFMPFFEDKHASIRMIADDMHRSRIALQLKSWFNKNIGAFEL
jgi:hypothetical protein